jgi:hypothetical protein
MLRQMTVECEHRFGGFHTEMALRSAAVRERGLVAGDRSSRPELAHDWLSCRHQMQQAIRLPAALPGGADSYVDRAPSWRADQVRQRAQKLARRLPRAAPMASRPVQAATTHPAARSSR